MCGIAGYMGSGNAISIITSILLELQHRGQEAAGIAVATRDGSIHRVVGKGLVVEALSYENLYLLYNLDGIVGGIGHVRYSTSGGYLDSQAQPIVVGDNSLKIAVAFNGTIANYASLAKAFGFGNVNGDAKLLSMLLYRLAKELGNDVVEALKILPMYVVGGYSIAVLTSEPRVVVAKDPHGFRPLSISFANNELYIASETAALEIASPYPWREVLPGEIISFDGRSLEQTKSPISRFVSPCVFEYVYFSRPDSVFNGVNIYVSRVRMGEELAKEVPTNGDVVIPVPDSGRAAAIGFSKVSGIPIEEGIVVNKYVGRGFIAPPTMRDFISRFKYGFVKDVVNGKRIVLVDDSIVRGTTMRNIVRRLREIGAREVHVRVASPPFRYPCFMGIDVASRDELIAWRLMDLDDIARAIEADSVGYNSVQGLRKAVGIPLLCYACFTGLYPFRGLDVDALEKSFVR